ncbi:alpha/beta fold hydrolase [Saccharopolyspora cebuensis]
MPLGARELTRVPLPDDGVGQVDLSATPPPGRFAEVLTRWGPLRVHVRETPGPPGAPIAVLLHGLAGSSTNWTDLADVLRGHLRGVAVDLPGFGWSEPPDGFRFDRHEHAEVLIALLDRIGEPVHLAGNSYGGAVAAEVAARRPDLVAGLVLISPAVPDLRPSPSRISDRRLIAAALPVIGARARRRLAEVTARERAERLVRLVFAEPEVVPPHRLAEVVEELREREVLHWAGTALNRTTSELVRSWVQPPSLWRSLTRVPAPALVVWGSEDAVISARKAPRTARALPRGRLLVLPRTGHVAQLERPRMVARALLGLVRSGDSW